MSEKEYIQEACRELNSFFTNIGFIISKNGLIAKRKIDSDITQEIFCQITNYHEVIIHFSVYSKKVKKWLKETYQLENAEVSGLGGQLGYISKQNVWKTWQIGKSDIAKSQFLKEAKEMIDTFLIPYFDTFYNIPSMLDHICYQGGISTQTPIFAPPISFVLQYGTVEQAQILLENYLINNPKQYQSIQRHKTYFDKDTALFPIPFIGADQIKTGINNGVIIDFNK